MSASQSPLTRPAFNAATLATTALVGLIAVSLVLPGPVTELADWVNGVFIMLFGAGYVWVLALATVCCLALAAWPRTGRLKLGREDDAPEFSLFAWISMMYGAGISAALLKWSVAEPFHYMGDNPELIQGLTATGTYDNMRMAIKWAFLHWGFGAWACYAIIGLAFAFICFRRGLPLNSRSLLSPLMQGKSRDAVAMVLDATLVVASVLCLLQIIGFGVTHTLTSVDYLFADTAFSGQNATLASTVATVAIVCAAAYLSVRAGLTRGIKRFSILNIGLSVVLLGLLLTASSFSGFNALIVCIGDYLFAFPDMAFRIWRGDGDATSLPSQLKDWQVQWSMFHWTWWIPFGAFVGLFMARISKGRTVREFVLGALIAPALICFVWLTWAGGTAISLHLADATGMAVASIDDANKLFAVIQTLFTPNAAWVLCSLVIAMVWTYLITTVDSAVLVISSLTAKGRVTRDATSHTPIWIVLLAGTVLIAEAVGAHGAFQALACLCALPITGVILLTMASLLRDVFAPAPTARAAADTGVVMPQTDAVN